MDLSGIPGNRQTQAPGASAGAAAGPPAGSTGATPNAASNGAARATTMEREQASRFLRDLLKLMASRNGSDLFLTADFPPAFKIDGKLTPVSAVPLTAQHTI